jgi:parallel beta-helix repeat protein
MHFFRSSLTILQSSLAILAVYIQPAKATGTLSIIVGSSNAQTELVTHSDLWRYWKGRTAPRADWAIATDLSLGDQANAGEITFFTSVGTNFVLISGACTIPEAARIVINGSDAEFHPGAGDWAKTNSLSPGFNRLLIEVLRENEEVLLSTNKDIVAEISSTFTGGTIATNVSWEKSMGIIHLTNDLIVPPGETLAIAAGTVILVPEGVSVRLTDSSLIVVGSANDPVYFLPENGRTVWGGLVASGTNASLSLRYTETIAGFIELLEGASGTIEDSYLHDYEVESPAIVHTLRAASLVMRRCHIARYYEVLSQLALNQIEDCLCEYQASGGDGIDFDGAMPGSFIRRCTIRHGKFDNIDALDMGEFSLEEPSQGVRIEDCLLYDFVDKGISIGIAKDLVAHNCLIYSTGIGIAVKDSSTATLYNNTVTASGYGFRLYEKTPAQGGGHGVTYNNILWANTTNIFLDALSSLAVSESDIAGGEYPGTGNISVDPLFSDSAGRDFSLAANSPAARVGKDNAQLGARFPVGAPMAPSHPVFVSARTNEGRAVLAFYADTERSYSLESSDSIEGSTWVKLADFWPQPLPRLVEFTNSLSGSGARFYRLLSR